MPIRRACLVTRLAACVAAIKPPRRRRQAVAGLVGKHPDDMAAAERVAEINIATGKFDDAAKYLELLLKRKPHDPVALNNLAWVYQQQGNDAQARTLARQAYVLSPGPQTADTLGWILTTAGNAASGVALLRQASGEGAADPRIHYHYAVALKDTGDKDEARKQLETVVANKAEFKEKAEAQKLLDDSWRRAAEPFFRNRRLSGMAAHPPADVFDAVPQRGAAEPRRYSSKTGCGTWWPAARRAAPVLAPVPWFPSRPAGSATGH